MTCDNVLDISNKITIDDYQRFTRRTFVVHKDNAEVYLIAGIASESGEVAGQYAKYKRGDFSREEYIKRVEKELGDVLYMVARYADFLGVDIRDILQSNVNKLTCRLDSGKIRGDGDDR